MARILAVSARRDFRPSADAPARGINGWGARETGGSRQTDEAGADKLA